MPRHFDVYKPLFEPYQGPIMFRRIEVLDLLDPEDHPSVIREEDLPRFLGEYVE